MTTRERLDQIDAQYASKRTMPEDILDEYNRLNAQFVTEILARKLDRRNARRRAENQILRDMRGTSAQAAREDMGL